MPEQSHPLVQLAGSERGPLAGATPAGQPDTSERAELTLVLRRGPRSPPRSSRVPPPDQRPAGRAVRGRPRRRGPGPADAHRPGA